MTEPLHPTLQELEARLDEIRSSPRDSGRLELIVRRPATLEREVVEEAELDPVEGMVGDNWKARGSKRTADGSAHPGMQLTLMSSRVIDAVARQRERWALAGDQLYVDLDLSAENLPPGTRLSLASAVVEVTDQPHTGCGKFRERFGRDAVVFIHSALGKKLQLRGINARVVQGGTVRVGDRVRKEMK